MEAENVATHPVMVRRVGPVIMAREVERASGKTRVWKKAGIVSVVGALFGFAASFWLEAPKALRGVQMESGHPQQTSVLVAPAESAPAKQMINDPVEMERLKIRNRRLEALVQVLQRRAQTGKRSTGLKIKN